MLSSNVLIIYIVNIFLNLYTVYAIYFYLKHLENTNCTCGSVDLYYIHNNLILYTEIVFYLTIIVIILISLGLIFFGSAIIEKLKIIQ
jgi:hypothetical protein